MTTALFIFLACFLFGLGISAGVALGRAGVRVDQLLARFDRDLAINDAADMGEFR